MAPAAEPDPPRIAVDPPRFDFGRALANKELYKTFRIVNIGGSELHIEGVTTDCDCTVVGEYETALAPGRRTALKVRLTTPAEEGRIVRRLVVRSDDPERERLVVELRVEVVAQEP